MSTTAGTQDYELDMASGVYRPRGRFLINGVQQFGFESCEVNSNNYQRGDTFHAQIAPPPGATWFDPPDSRTPLDCQIQFGFLPEGANEGAVSDWQLMIQGGIDTMRWDPITRNLSIEGRDYSARLIDFPTMSASFLNMTSSDVVQSLVQSLNETGGPTLTTQVVPTTTPVGQYFQIEHKHLGAISHSRDTRAWDLLSRLARFEQYDLFVLGTCVYFQPQLSNMSTPVELPINLTDVIPMAPVMSLNMERQAGLTKDVVVEVHSWDAQQRKVYVGLWPPKQPSSSTIDVQKYAFMRPHLLQADCDKEAKALYSDIVAHQRTVTYEMPGNISLTPRQRVRLSGTQTSWDGIYRVDSVNRAYGLERGFVQEVTLRNRDAIAAETDGTEDL